MGDPPPEEAVCDGEDQVVFELMDSAPVVLLAPQSPQPIIEHHPASNDGCFATRRNAAVERMTREAERMSTTARSTVQAVREAFKEHVAAARFRSGGKHRRSVSLEKVDDRGGGLERALPGPRVQRRRARRRRRVRVRLRRGRRCCA